ncbi:unnamed protein product [Lupinus luteus]|uniref:Uncharacterized protein n=1 Tax=Lupinus luteus TaxID=3873 RepID=A0AAV1WSY2_LUPLU
MLHLDVSFFFTHLISFFSPNLFHKSHFFLFSFTHLIFFFSLSHISLLSSISKFFKSDDGSDVAAFECQDPLIFLNATTDRFSVNSAGSSVLRNTVRFPPFLVHIWYNNHPVPVRSPVHRFSG